MKHAKILDCTLRDGAYLVDKTFGDNAIHGIIAGLMKAKVDCIEIGFFQDEGFGEGKTVYKNSNDAKKYVPKDKTGCMFTVLADCSRYTITNLDMCSGDSVDAIRECFFKEERFEAIENCKEIKAKGYKCFVQPVDILGYSDGELIELLQLVNEVEPYCFSIVDTFGSMYQEDLHRVFEIINHNLVSGCRIGFHSHNNMQLSNALSQEFLRIAAGKRECIIDGTISGMGRGAGNTPTELIMQYMISQWGYSYEVDAILDIIDSYMENIRAKCSWGYSTPYFIAGSYGAHVNNIKYLLKKNSIKSKDIRFILNKIGAISRKRYDYDLLEKKYLEYMMSDIDDSYSLSRLKDKLDGKNVLLLIPGKTLNTYCDEINKYIKKEKPVVIAVNSVHDFINADYIYISNQHRYDYWKTETNFINTPKIIASNLKYEPSEKDYVVSFNRLVKCGWELMDNSALMVLRLLDYFDISSLSIAGFDGYSRDYDNYASASMEIAKVQKNPAKLNEEIEGMLREFHSTRKHSFNIEFLTPTRFGEIFREVNY